jgi:hypothetical protein
MYTPDWSFENNNNAWQEAIKLGLTTYNRFKCVFEAKPKITPTSVMIPTPAVTPTSAITPTPSVTPTPARRPTPAVMSTSAVTPTLAVTSALATMATPVCAPTAPGGLQHLNHTRKCFSKK